MKRTRNFTRLYVKAAIGGLSDNGLKPQPQNTTSNDDDTETKENADAEVEEDAGN